MCIFVNIRVVELIHEEFLFVILDHLKVVFDPILSDFAKIKPSGLAIFPPLIGSKIHRDINKIDSLFLIRLFSISITVSQTNIFGIWNIMQKATIHQFMLKTTTCITLITWCPSIWKLIHLISNETECLLIFGKLL